MGVAKWFAGIAVALVVGFLTGRLSRSDRHGPKSVVTPAEPAVVHVAPPAPAPLLKRPNRPPDLDGTIESVSWVVHQSKATAVLMIRCAGPDNRWGVGLFETAVEDHGGVYGPGAKVTIWHRGVTTLSYPTGVSAEYVIVEAGSK